MCRSDTCHSVGHNSSIERTIKEPLKTENTNFFAKVNNSVGKLTKYPLK